MLRVDVDPSRGALKPTVETRSPSPELREEAGLPPGPAFFAFPKSSKALPRFRLGIEAPQVPSPANPPACGASLVSRDRGIPDSSMAPLSASRPSLVAGFNSSPAGRPRRQGSRGLRLPGNSSPSSLAQGNGPKRYRIFAARRGSQDRKRS